MNGHQNHQACVPLGFFLRDTQKCLVQHEKDKLPGLPAKPDHCSMLGSHKGYVEKDKQWVTFFKVSINQNGDRAKHNRQNGVFLRGSKSIGYPVRYT
jgi:hypothetical protein